MAYMPYMRSLCAMMLAATAMPALTEPQALLIGVGDYKVLDADLFGIDVDMETMTAVARNLGFKETEIKVLLDSDATYKNIRDALKDLGRTIGPDDNALIYFSGHGTARRRHRWRRSR